MAERAKLAFVDSDYVRSDGSAGTVVLDCNDGVSYAFMLDTFTPRPAPQRQSLADSPLTDGRTFRPGLDKLESVMLPFSVRITGSDADDCRDKAVALLDAARDHRLHVVYSPPGSTALTFYDIIPAAEFDTDRYWRRGYEKTSVIDFEIEASCGYGTRRTLEPLKNLAPNASFEEWLEDELVSWEFALTDGSTIVKSDIAYHGEASAQMTVGGLCSMACAHIPVDATHHHYLDVRVQSTDEGELWQGLTCYDEEGELLGGVSLAEGPFRAAGPEFDRHALRLYSTDLIARPYIRPSDFPEGTATVRINITNVQQGTFCRVDAVMFCDVEHVAGYVAEGITGLNLSAIEGDLPALCDITVSDPYGPPRWQKLRVENFIAAELRDVAFGSPDVVWMVGKMPGGPTAIVLKSVDGGLSWEEQEIEGLDAVCVDAVSDNTAWALVRTFLILSDGSTNYHVIRTTNGGATWEVVLDTSGIPALNLYLTGPDVVAVSSDVAWLVGIKRYYLTPLVYKTTDGGQNWTPQEVPAEAVPWTRIRLAAADASTAWLTLAAQSTSSVYRTTNGGATWEVVANPYATDYSNEPLLVAAYDANTAWLAREIWTYTSSVYRTTDGGETWEEQAELAFGVYTLRAVSDTGLVACGHLGVAISQAGGATWDLVDYRTESYSAMDAWSLSLVIAVNQDGKTYGRGLGNPLPLPIDTLVIGQRDGAFDPAFRPVLPPPSDAGALGYHSWLPWNSYRAMAAGNIAEFAFNLRSHAGGYYAITAGVAFSGATAYALGTLRKKVRTTDAVDITTQYAEEEVALIEAQGHWQEVVLQDETWDDAYIPSHLVSDNALLSNLEQIMQLVAHEDLGEVEMHLSHLGIIPVDRWIRITEISSNYITCDSTMGEVFDSRDGSASTAIAHDPTHVESTPRFQLLPGGTNMVLLAIRDESPGQYPEVVGIEIAYRPRTKLHF